MGFLHGLRERLGLADIPGEIAASYASLRPECDTMTLRPEWTPHQAALLRALARHYNGPRGIRIPPQEMLLVEILPFLLLPEREGVHSLGHYLHWRRRPRDVALGPLCEQVTRGVALLAAQESGLTRLYPSSFFEDNWGNVLLSQAEWQPLLTHGIVGPLLYTAPMCGLRVRTRPRP